MEFQVFPAFHLIVQVFDIEVIDTEVDSIDEAAEKCGASISRGSKIPGVKKI